MKKIILISCVSRKRGHRARASDLYISPLFRLTLRYANRLKPDATFLLSAKHGLLDLETEIEPYDTRLNKMNSAQRKRWAERIVTQLKQKVDLENDHFVLLAGLKYRENLIPHIRLCEIPLEGLPIGKQLQQLRRFLNE